MGRNWPNQATNTNEDRFRSVSHLLETERKIRNNSVGAWNFQWLNRAPTERKNNGRRRRRRHRQSSVEKEETYCLQRLSASGAGVYVYTPWEANLRR